MLGFSKYRVRLPSFPFVTVGGAEMRSRNRSMEGRDSRTSAAGTISAQASRKGPSQPRYASRNSQIAPSSSK